MRVLFSTVLTAILFLSGRALASDAPGVAAQSPVFDPMVFFTGHTRSWGVMEDRRGRATEIIQTETWGRMVHGELRMEQDLFFGQHPRQHRSWRMQRVDATHFQATASGILGAARGEARGNTFTWSFALATKPGHALYNVRMTQRMYLQPDGRTMINRDTVRKFGFLVAEVTEEFRKL